MQPLVIWVQFMSSLQDYSFKIWSFVSLLDTSLNRFNLIIYFLPSVGHCELMRFSIFVFHPSSVISRTLWRKPLWVFRFRVFDVKGFFQREKQCGNLMIFSHNIQCLLFHDWFNALMLSRNKKRINRSCLNCSRDKSKDLIMEFSQGINNLFTRRHQRFETVSDKCKNIVFISQVQGCSTLSSLRASNSFQ